MRKGIALFLVTALGLFFLSTSGRNLQDIKELDFGAKRYSVKSENDIDSSLKTGFKPGQSHLYFIHNKGQVNRKAKFYAKASRYTLWMTKEGFVFDSSLKIKNSEKPGKAEFEEECITQFKRDVSRLFFRDANKNPQLIALGKANLKVNYFKGNDKSQWNCNIPTSTAVLYKNLYEKIDLKVYGIEKQIEYDWIIKPGGVPGDIKFEYDNVKGTRIDSEGNLLVMTGFGELMHKRPISYQESGSKRVPVPVKFKKIGTDSFGFVVGDYNKNKELIIDPVILAYSTYLGGPDEDFATAIAVDNSGYAYVAGYTLTAIFPILDQYQADQGDMDVFVTKIDTANSGIASLIYSTYLGGSNEERAYELTVDGSGGNVYVTGFTTSTNFPTRNAYQGNHGDGNEDVFVTRLDTTQSGASGLVYSTYLGGAGYERGRGIALDGSGFTYVTGATGSIDFPVLNEYQADPGDSNEDVFVTKLDTAQSGASSLIYSTYLGGGDIDRARGIAADSSGNAYIAGYIYSTDFPTLNQYQGNPNPAVDIFVSRIDTTRSGTPSLIYSTYLGGLDTDIGYGIATDGNGHAYVVGRTRSLTYPVRNAYLSNRVRSTDAIISRIDTNESGDSSLIYSTFLGGYDMDEGLGIAVEGSSGYVYVTGFTDSRDFPTLNQYQVDPGDSERDAFVSKLDTNLSGTPSLIFSTYLGGSDLDRGMGIAVDGSGNVYVAGNTISPNFPTLNRYQGRMGLNDAFVTKLVFDAVPPTVIAPSCTCISDTATTAVLGGVVSSIGNTNVTERGVYWSTVNGFTPPAEGSKTGETGNWSTTGSFSVDVQGLSPETTFYFKAFATNSEGTGFSIQNSCIPSNNPTISGTVSNINSKGLQYVRITFSHDGHTEITAADGTYSYPVLYGTTTTVTASGTGYGFTPSQYSYSNLTANKTNQDFTAHRATISGRVRDGSTGLQNVTITFSHNGHTETTTASGAYTYTVNYGTTTTVTASKTGYAFTPSQYSYSDLTENKSNQDFTTYHPSISGTVTNGSSGLKDVVITFSHDGHTETTSADGTYSYTVLSGTTTTVTASKAGYAFTPSQYNYSNLTESKSNQDFSVVNFVSVTIASPADGDTVSGTVEITAKTSSVDPAALDAVQSVTHIDFYIDSQLAGQDTEAPYRYDWKSWGVTNGSHTIKVIAYHSAGLTSEHQISVNVTNEPAHIHFNRDRFNFGALLGDGLTGPQAFHVSNTGGGVLDWVTTVSDTWIQAAPSSGTGSGYVTVSISPAGLTPGIYTGTVTITDPRADNSPASVDIYLQIKTTGQEQPPFGHMETPLDGAAVSGSIPVTGWAIDDIEVSSVKIYRNGVPGIESGPVYIGDAVFVEGARTDIEQQYSQYPKNHMAGWGYMMLTNSFHDGGNGPYVITAIATDSSGSTVVLDSKTIFCDNQSAVKPFGTIDTPTQGGSAPGSNFVNFGWALTPMPNTIPRDGSTIKVLVDGVPLEGNPVYNIYREDVAAAFPGYTNSNGASGYYYLDTAGYENGVHTISWLVTDDAGNSAGIGSRYFSIQNHVSTTSMTTGKLTAGKLTGKGTASGKREAIKGLPVNPHPVLVLNGYNGYKNNESQRLYPDSNGIITVELKELEPLVIYTTPHPLRFTPCRAGYLKVGQRLRPLPTGSTLDAKRGVFYWQPGPGFTGNYLLVFIMKDSNGELNRKAVNVTIKAKSTPRRPRTGS
ncbi:MAG: hypothetical protein GY757_25780 [bacterium]|nr:hypothetical protein [bacterium]